MKPEARTRTCHISYFVLNDKYLPLFICFHFQIENQIDKSIVNKIENFIDRVGKEWEIQAHKSSASRIMGWYPL